MDIQAVFVCYPIQRTGSVMEKFQAIECLLCKHESLSSKPNSARRKYNSVKIGHYQTMTSRTRKLRAGGVIQVAEHLSSNCEAMNSNPNIVKKNQNKVTGPPLLHASNPTYS
jgi:hypothetical protein